MEDSDIMDSSDGVEVGVNDLELSPVNKSIRNACNEQKQGKVLEVKVEPGLVTNCRIENGAGYGVFEKSVHCSNPDSCTSNCVTCRENCFDQQSTYSNQKVDP